MKFLRILLLPLLSVLLVTEHHALGEYCNSNLEKSSIEQSSEKTDTRVGNLSKQVGATKIPGATVKLPISYTRAQKESLERMLRRLLQERETMEREEPIILNLRMVLKLTSILIE